MEIIKQNIDELSASITLKVQESDYAPKVEAALKKTRQRAEIKGFRKGMAPVSLIKKMYGESVLMEQLNEFINNSIHNYLTEQSNLGLDIIGEPLANETDQLDLEHNKNFELNYTIGWYPKYELDLASLTLPYYEIVDEQHVEKMVNSNIDQIRQQGTQLKDIDVVESVTDVLYVEINGTLTDGEKYTKSDALFALDTLSEAHQQLFLGKNIKDVINVDVKATFTNQVDLSSMLDIAHDELKLLPEIMTFEIIRVSSRIIPELDQNLIDQMQWSDVNNVEDLTAFIKKGVTDNLKGIAMQQLQVDLESEILKACPQELPDAFIKRLMLASNTSENSAEKIEAEYPEIKKTIILNHASELLCKQNDIHKLITREMIYEQARKEIEMQFRAYGLSDFSRFPLDQFIEQKINDKQQLDQIFENLKRQLLTEKAHEVAVLDIRTINVDDFTAMLEAKKATAENKADA